MNEFTPSEMEKSTGNGKETSSTEQPSEVAALQSQIKDLETQLKDKESRYVYLYAEFENFKKRSIKERSDLIKFGWEPLAQDLLQTVDNLERALAHVSPSTDKNLIEGLKMILGQLKDCLQKQGLQPVAGLNQPFDPNFHEAVGQEPSELPEGTVTQIHSMGYTLHGRLVRPSRVMVSSGPVQENS